MKIVGKTVLGLVLIAAGAAVVIAVPGIITRARWYPFTQRATRFMAAVERMDTATLRSQSADSMLLHQMLALRSRRPALVRAAASSLTVERAQREGDTVLVGLRTTHSSCRPPGEPDRIRLAFVLQDGEYRVAWLTLAVCRASP